MTTRGFFNNVRASNEQDLVESLIIESIQTKGVDVQYLIREKVNPDVLLGESTISTFDEYYVIEMYIDLMTQYNGDGDIFTGFGMSFPDHAEFLVSSRRFKEELDSAGLIRPREGDLIYLPFSDSLWEISKVKQDHQYYQLGKNYQYRIVCNLFQYSHENLNLDSPTDLNAMDTINMLDESGLREAIGLKLGDVRDETITLETMAESIDAFDPDQDFQF